MVKLQRVQRPKTQRGKRALKEREPKLLENARSCLTRSISKCVQISVIYVRFVKSQYRIRIQNALKTMIILYFYIEIIAVSRIH